MTTNELQDGVREWFTQFGGYCAAVDYDSAAVLIAPDVVSFGTRMDIVSGLDNLMANQWRSIWPNIRDFRFDLSSLHSGGVGSTAWGVCLWTSTGFHEDGAGFERSGRATVILEVRAGRRVATHTHFSLNPGTSPRTYGTAVRR